jgi:hypothetical protein
MTSTPYTRSLHADGTDPTIARTAYIPSRGLPVASTIPLELWIKIALSSFLYVQRDPKSSVIRAMCVALLRFGLWK